MLRADAVIALMVLTGIVGCGGTTTTGTKRNIDVGGGRDGSPGGNGNGSGGFPALGGATGTGGRIAAGGGPTDPCAGVRCANPNCPAGFVPVALPGQCCPTGCASTIGDAGVVPACCSSDADCRGKPGSECVNTICLRPAAGICWRDGDCASHERCDGAKVCGCASDCSYDALPGKCVPLSGSIDGSVVEGGRQSADAAEASMDGADSHPVDCATSTTCPSDSCELTCCPGSGECAPCCVPKSCQSYDAAHCPLDGCQILPTCAGTSVCYPFFTAPPPLCGGVGYYGNHAPCCAGVTLRCGLPQSDGSCDLTVGGYNGFPMCIGCGDGNCNTTFENRCNCPEDCH